MFYENLHSSATAETKNEVTIAYALYVWPREAWC